jgi:MoaA/NifB/PqqE/SkfB family radical SAM enzyme
MTTTEMHEWLPEKKWNPFNSYKLLAHLYRWRLIKRGSDIPPPVLVTVDPINLCNLGCEWCNSDIILKKRNGIIEGDALLDIAEGLAQWRGSPDWPGGVEGVCIAGGGEPLLHPDIGKFIESCTEKGIEVGVVTNGINIEVFISHLALCTWVGVSVDAGSAQTYEKLKGRNSFDKVCRNINKLTEYASKNQCTLGRNLSGNGVSFKYLLYEGNVQEVETAAKIAKEIGCKSFHLRPAGIPWNKLNGSKKSLFDGRIRNQLIEKIDAARFLEDGIFSIYGITHKFGHDLNIANNFNKCHAIFMTAVFMPPRDEGKEKFCVTTCCDRRGDPRLEFKESITEFKQLERLWGSEEHWQIFDSIKVKDCPRCTYQPHNQIFEHVILSDNMTYKFI